MAQKNFDYETGSAIEEWLRLNRETLALEEKAAKNRERMKALLKDYPQIGNVKGMLKIASDAPAPQTTSNNNTNISLPSPAPPPQPSGKTQKRKASREASIGETVSALEKKREIKKPRAREVAVEQGGKKFHATSHSSPPPVVPDLPGEKEKQ